MGRPTHRITLVSLFYHSRVCGKDLGGKKIGAFESLVIHLSSNSSSGKLFNLTKMGIQVKLL